MNTTYDDILDLALVSIEDYRLNKLSETDINRFYAILDGFMIRGLANFDNCKKDLSDRDDVARKFNFALSDVEKSILADYTVIMWLDKEINDTRQITGMLENNKEAHRYSEANNLTAKMNRRIEIDEEVSQKKTIYGFKSISVRDWARDNYE